MIGNEGQEGGGIRPVTSKFSLEVTGPKDVSLKSFQAGVGVITCCPMVLCWLCVPWNWHHTELLYVTQRPRRR